MRTSYLISLLFVVIVAAVGAVDAHLCVLAPIQRGNISGLNEVATSNCFLLDAPCGGRPKQDTQMLRGGENFTIIYQYNENHFNETNPGNVTITLVPTDPEESMQVLATIQDDDLPALTLFTVTVSIPAFSAPWSGYIQSVWYTNTYNVLPHLTFYQCSDVLIAPV